MVGQIRLEAPDGERIDAQGGSSGVDLRIREVRAEDAAGVVAILNPIIEAGVYTAFDAPFSEEQERAYIGSLPERAIFLVAVSWAPMSASTVGVRASQGGCSRRRSWPRAARRTRSS
jgi:hypothetical protein